jgi:hypothetical protein
VSTGTVQFARLCVTTLGWTLTRARTKTATTLVAIQIKAAPTKLSLIACARTIRTAATIGTLIVPVVPLTLSAPNVIVSDVNGILTQPVDFASLLLRATTAKMLLSTRLGGLVVLGVTADLTTPKDAAKVLAILEFNWNLATVP